MAQAHRKKGKSQSAKMVLEAQLQHASLLKKVAESMKDLCFDRNTTSQHWEAVASPKSIEIHRNPSISASKRHSMRSRVAFHQHVVVQHVAALQHGCTATIRKTLQSNHVQFHSLGMDQHSLGART